MRIFLGLLSISLLLSISVLLIELIRPNELRPKTQEATFSYRGIPVNGTFPRNPSELELIRLAGDLVQQRHHLWEIFGLLTQFSQSTTEPVFATWFNEFEVFANSSQPVSRNNLRFPGMPPGMSSGRAQRINHSADAPIMTFVHYNFAAKQHIRLHDLHTRNRLDELRHSGKQDLEMENMRTIPPFPSDAVTIMTGWWPISENEGTPMPIWDPENNKPKSGGNNYTSWSRVVMVDPVPRPEPQPNIKSVEFAGRSFPDARRVQLDRFYHIKVDPFMAATLMDDPGSKKAAIIALGRPLASGDYLALVALHVVTMEVRSGIWGTFWWHDQPEDGQFAIGRPESMASPWRNYLMDVAFDTVLPRTDNLNPRVCFNPWFEAKFPDGGHGNGMTSNCVNCHSRAGYPRIGFLPILRGPPDFHNDPAFAKGRLRTGQLWSVANPGE